MPLYMMVVAVAAAAAGKQPGMGKTGQDGGEKWEGGWR